MNSITAFIIPSLSVGGAEIQTIKHVNYLYQHGHETFLIILSNKVPLIDQVKLPNKNILQINKKQFEYNFDGIKSTIFQQGLISNFLRDNNIGVIVAVLPLAHFCGRLLKMRAVINQRKLKLIIYHRAAFYDMNPANSIGKKIMKVTTQWLSKRYDDHAIYISNHVKKVIESNVSIKCSSTVIYNSCEFPENIKRIEKEVGLLLREWGFDKNILFILVPGRLHPAKGQDDLIKTVSLLQGNSMDLSGIKFIIAGDGDHRDFLMKLRDDLKLTQSIFFAGEIRHEVLIGLNMISSWVVIPSRAEGLGNVAIEALMCEANILSSDAGGLKEVIVDGKTGFLFKSGDIQDLARMLEKILKREITPLPKSSLRAHYEENFSLEMQMEKLLQIFKA